MALKRANQPISEEDLKNEVYLYIAHFENGRSVFGLLEELKENKNLIVSSSELRRAVTELVTEKRVELVKEEVLGNGCYDVLVRILR